MQLTIDPGFVHQRKIQALVGDRGMKAIDDAIAKMPADLPDWQQENRIDHIYKDVLLAFCRALRVPTLQEIYLKEHGQLFCSVDEYGPAPAFYDSLRASNAWIPPFQTRKTVEIHYSTKLVRSDTQKCHLYEGGHPLAVIGQLAQASSSTVIFEPLVIGSPWLAPGDVAPNFDFTWFGNQFYENYIEDFDEFAKCREITSPADSSEMRAVSERAFKSCLAKILGDHVEKDWGGEQSDFYSAHLHLSGGRFTAAFLLKGPARFSPMKLATSARTTTRYSDSRMSLPACCSSSTVTILHLPSEKLYAHSRCSPAILVGIA